jgi:hypothetical protein
MPGVQAAYEYPLTERDVETIGDFTRENVARWVAIHAGDFAFVMDFYATIGDEEIPWSDEESESIYNDLTCPCRE